MNEQQFGKAVRQLLNQGLRFDARRSDRLREARELALRSQRPQPGPAFAWADKLLGNLGGWSELSLRVLAPLVALVIGLGAVYTWQQKQRVAEVEEIDALLLTDDLPIDAYLDRGFQNWLKKRQAER